MMSFDLDKALSWLMQVSIILFAAMTILLSVSVVVPLDNTLHVEIIGSVSATEIVPTADKEYVEWIDGQPVTYLEFPEFHITGRVH